MCQLLLMISHSCAVWLGIHTDSLAETKQPEVICFQWFTATLVKCCELVLQCINFMQINYASGLQQCVLRANAVCFCCSLYNALCPDNVVTFLVLFCICCICIALVSFFLLYFFLFCFDLFCSVLPRSLFCLVLFSISVSDLWQH